jgi:hypothetical protein
MTPIKIDGLALKKLLDEKYNMEINIFGRFTPVGITTHSTSNHPPGYKIAVYRHLNIRNYN